MRVPMLFSLAALRGLRTSMRLLATQPTLAEMTPGSPEMLARANEVKARLGERVLSPLEASSFLMDEDADVVDVRTLEQAAAHEINGQAGRTIRGSSRVSLDAMVAGEEPSPPRERPLLLACSRGPKSLVALDYLSEKCARVYTIDGGITAWDQAGLPTQDVGS